MMMDDERSFTEVLDGLKQVKNKRDPRAVRLAAVASALLDVVGEEVTASKVFAKAITALEGTLQSTQNTSIADSLATQVALLELLHITIPKVSPPAIISATLPMTSRVLRAVVASSQDLGNEAVMETKDELGGVNSVLRWNCRVSTEVLRRLGVKTDRKVVELLLRETLLHLFKDRRPKVRKAAHNGVIELLLMEEPTRCHPAIVKLAGSYVRSHIAAADRDASSDYSDLLQLLPFVEKSILCLPYKDVASDAMKVLVSLLRMDEASPMMTDFVAVTKISQGTPKILAINALLSTILVVLQESSDEVQSFLIDFAPRVLASLLQAQPSVIFCSGRAEDEILAHGLGLFGQTIIASCAKILDSNVELACKLLPLSIKVILVLSRPNEDLSEDASVANALFLELMQLFRGGLSSLMTASNSDSNKCLRVSLQSMAQVIHLDYSPTWSISLKCFVVMLEKVHTQVDVSTHVEALLALRDEAKTSSTARHSVEDAFSALVQSLGIETTWKWIRWQPGKEDWKSIGIHTDRAWVLFTLKAAGLAAQPVRPRLAFFQSEVLGVARVSDRLAAKATSDRMFHQTCVVDLWALFPCFCKSAADVEVAMPSLTATLSRAVEDKRYPQILPIVCSGISGLVKELRSSDNQKDSDAVALASSKLLPILFKLVTELGGCGAISGGNDTRGPSASAPEVSQQMQIVAEAISSLAGVAPAPFIRGLFQKLMQRLLNEVQSSENSVDRVCSLLTLSEALVASHVLDESSVLLLYRALKPIVRSDESAPRVQKKAYKVLAELCEGYHGFMTESQRLVDTMDLLTSTITTSQVSARHMRLKCLNILVSGFKGRSDDSVHVFFGMVGEVLLCLKDSNAKTREAAFQLLLSLSGLNRLSEFLEAVASALGSETAHMRSAAVMAMSRIVFELGWENEDLRGMLPSLLKTVIVLMNENSREVIKSVVGFIRIAVAAMSTEQLEPLLPELMSGLLTYHKRKDRFRAKIKIILKKLVKSFGYDRLLPFVPVEETRLLTHMRKLDERQKRRKLAQREFRSRENTFEEMLESDEEDSDDGKTLMSGATGLSRLSRKSRAAMSIASKGAKSMAGQSQVSSKSMAQTASVRLPDEGDGEVVDMLNTAISRRVKFADDVEDSDSDDGVMEFDDDGMLVIRDNRSEHDDNLDRVGHEEASTSSSNLKKKRRLNDTSSTIPTENKRSKKKSAGLGAAYKSKKAGGDVKRKGQKLEPYAFVPLDGRSYSKKNRREAVQKMSSVVRAGHKRKQGS